METSTTIKRMLMGNQIFVPEYQRADSWETSQKDSSGHTNRFFSDLEEHSEIKTQNPTPYYFGHFLFQAKEDEKFDVIDGQQRLTTIVIFLSALFVRLKQIRALDKKEKAVFEDMIKRYETYRFDTVEYDKQFFRDYVIDQVKVNKDNLETVSAKRIVAAFDFFLQELSSKNEKYLLKMLGIIQHATCTTHLVKDESEAIQMFIFQNNRGKKPSVLEIVKAQFMFNIHLHGGNNITALTGEMNSRFETIYKSIGSIEDKINEDHVLLYTLRAHFDSLWVENSMDTIDKALTDAKPNPIKFIKDFTQDLEESFQNLKTFFKVDESKNHSIHSFITLITELRSLVIAIPFIIKAYSFGLPIEEIGRLCASLETLVLRHRLIGTRADLTSRINEVYKEFKSTSKDIQPIIDRIDWLKDRPDDDWWSAYWNTTKLKESIKGEIERPIAKFLLWKYENYLEEQGQKGYTPMRFDKIDKPQLEHIAPQKPRTNDPVAAGYPEYTDEFTEQYIDLLGNYLLISKSHNCSIGNKPFKEKRATYKHLWHHREVSDMTAKSQKWSKRAITERQKKITEFILKAF